MSEANSYKIAQDHGGPVFAWDFTAYMISNKTILCLSLKLCLTFISVLFNACTYLGTDFADNII